LIKTANQAKASFKVIIEFKISFDCDEFEKLFVIDSSNLDEKISCSFFNIAFAKDTRDFLYSSIISHE